MTLRSMPQVLIKNIIRQLNELHDGSLWFDQCFKDKIDNLPIDYVFKRPIPDVHSVAEHVSHMLEWRKECLLRFAGERTELMNSPDDWKNNIELETYGWTKLKEAFYNSRYELINLIKDRDDTYLETKFLDTDYNFYYLIEGIIQHDLYHLGQIGITIKLINENKNYR